MRRTNQERSESMRQILIEAARVLFVEKGYAETATPEIVSAAGVTRGALYHHFEDKKALFRAVVEREAEQVGMEIESCGDHTDDARSAIIKGTRAYFDAMSEPGRTRLLLLDGPAVLGTDCMLEIDRENAEATLAIGIAGLLQASGLQPDALSAIATLLSAAFDRAALAIEAGASRKTYEDAVVALIDGLAPR